MSDKPEDKEPEGPQPLTDETVYPHGPSTDPRVTSQAETEEEAKKREEEAKKPSPTPALSGGVGGGGGGTKDDKGKHS